MCKTEAGRVRAVICDVYGTLLRVAGPPPDAAGRWREGWKELTGETGTGPAIGEFNDRCARVIERQHAERKAAGEPWPEVDWLAVVMLAAPGGQEGKVIRDRAMELSRLHAACSRTCMEMPGAVQALHLLRERGIRAGLASNAQHYTRDELASAGISKELFEENLCFLSGDHRFAKPSPRVFSMLGERLAIEGIAPQEILMVGDSLEKDILPAAAAGWQTWHFCDGDPAAGWTCLAETMKSAGVPDRG